MEFRQQYPAREQEIDDIITADDGVGGRDSSQVSRRTTGIMQPARKSAD